jgi:epsilon-lactone hydrolase
MAADMQPTASLSARVTGAFLRATKLVSRRFQGGPHMLNAINLTRGAPLPLPTTKMRASLDVREDKVAGRSVWTIAPKGGAPTAHLLFFHGGGYVFSAVAPHWQFYARLAEHHGIAVHAPMYPLAPEHGAEEATAWALTAYRHLLAEHDGRFVLGGDSAGAGLAAATIMAAREAGDRLPEGLLLICPWLDISGTHPDQPTIEPRDSILRLRGIRDAGKLYARDVPLDDPRVSPIYGQWTDLPPVLMFGGSDDILVTDARALKTKLPTATYVEGQGLMHDWPLFFFGESRIAQRQMAQFIVNNGQLPSQPLT